MRHEADAGIAAAGYGKLNRQPGLVSATLGPDAANLLLPIANAYLDQEPLLAIIAQMAGDFSGHACASTPVAAGHLSAMGRGGPSRSSWRTASCFGTPRECKSSRALKTMPTVPEEKDNLGRL